MRFAYANEQRKVKGHLEHQCGLCVYGCVEDKLPPPPPFTFQNAPPPLARSTLLHKTCDSSILTDSWRFATLRGLSDFFDLYTTNNSF